MATRVILGSPVSMEHSPKGAGFLRVSIKLPIFGLKSFDITYADAQWVVDEGKKLLAAAPKQP